MDSAILNRGDIRAMELFQQGCTVYRKVVDYNYMFHREAYGTLRQILIEEAPDPFGFLDIACGDASVSLEALQGTRISRYRGIDLCRPALDLAARSLTVLHCPVVLECEDLKSALARCNNAPDLDVAWIGQSLHHFPTPEKLQIMIHIRRIIGPEGLLLIWEPTLTDGEDRDRWLDRFERFCHPLWTALTSAEWRSMLNHVRAADFPETEEEWRSLGRQAGFAAARCVFQTPNNISRMYYFRG